MKNKPMILRIGRIYRDQRFQQFECIFWDREKREFMIRYRKDGKCRSIRRPYKTWLGLIGWEGSR